MSTLNKYRAVCRLAALAVLETPRVGRTDGRVRRNLLNQIEDALTDAGFDMAAARTHMAKEKKRENAERRDRRNAERIAKYPVGTKVQNAAWNKYHRWTQGVVAEPDRPANKQQRDRGEVYVRWNDDDAGWVSAWDLEGAQ